MSSIKARATTPSDAKAVTRKPTTATRPVSNQSEKAGIRDGSRARLSTSRSDKEPNTTAVDAALRTKKPAAKPSVNNNDVEAAKSKKSGHPMPSQALNKHKQADPWSTKKKHKTNFGAAYAAGNIPCRINHGGIKNALQWNQSPEDLEYNPLLVTCCEGFQETDHPYVFLARQGFNDLMHANGADDKVRPLLGLLIPPIRAALMAPDDDVLVVTLKAIQAIADAVGSDMNVHLPKLIQQIHRKYSAKGLRATIDDTLAALERNGGPEALRIIRTKIPTYASLAQ
ncbi:hypothetical protein SPRG_09263 [Saprolegnia parasitica CBS 223.65]|uniref:PACRG-like protein n=1 Tax=Saprolegnia parasitica (strain CBS 223.65) TaxID=695850 RepID=A0A067CEZ7_SAPPC|nr:hypothetical protein SPRG_09263 [Saprolegnia parasitica CBS 223.65]KDO25116.1 hypothetical protein SPRG_09263 [Saprolegnia parasitica CBS 223.65]|eukprot:XP_012204186.1 hypothetical protein SPRG_09263 [Saprolegnia parasitica CBS 223.65]